MSTNQKPEGGGLHKQHSSHHVVDQITPEEKSAATLVRQVETMIQRDMSAENKLEPMVGYFKLCCLASGSDYLLMWVGWISALITGCGMPSFVFLIGDIIDSFKPTTKVEDTIDTVSRMSLIFTLVGIAVWFFSYLMYSSLLLFSDRVTKKIRVKYLEAILKQESSWFDTINPSELSARLSKEAAAIQKALGEKMGTIILAFAMTVAGLAFAFTRGWSFSLVLLVAFPFLGFTTSLMSKVLAKGSQETMKAYGQSAGYADQALNAIRVVAAYGQEEKEVRNYTKYLERARVAGVKTHCQGAFAMALFFASIFGTYAYSFYLGSVWIYNDIHNSTYNRTYTAGDILSCFFGVIFGMFSVGLATPNMKAVTEGKVAGKLAFDIIDRKPHIDQDNNKGKGTVDNIKGAIEFKNVDFYYPSRPDHQVLHNFSFKFEIGKTTAIVGPSGSGKSTIVQLIERFYDPNNGEVLIDGKNIKELCLREFRQKVGYVGQEPVLFNTTIRENIKFGCPGVTDEQIVNALKKSNAWEFINNKPEGIHLHVGAAGGQISGGQKQRVAIARAFIKNPKILIFDEATSALDKKNETEVQASIDAIRKELGAVTTVVIAHRLSTIRNADQIIVLKKGKLSEIGNHDSLLRDYPDGIYAKLVKQQQDSEETDENAAELDDIELDVDELDGQIDTNLTKKYLTGRQRSSPDKVTNEQKHETTYPAFTTTTPVPIEKQPKEIVKATKVQEDAPKGSGQKKMTKEELMKKNNADQADEEEEKKEEEVKKKIEKDGFMVRLQPYNKPFINVVLGTLVSIIQGGIFPVFGLLITKMLFALFITWDKAKLRHDSNLWCLGMFICCLTTLVTGFTQKFLFGIIGENITINIRQKLYGALLKKNIGWFDNRENAPGVLNSILAKDVQALNGASTEGSAVVMESTFAMIEGLALGFSFQWKVSLVALGCVPFMILGGAINTKFQSGYSNIDEDAYREANLLAGDTILNYRTVASFGHDYLIVNEYDKMVEAPLKNSFNKSQCIGFWFGFSQFVQNAVFALLYWAGAKFQVDQGTQDGANIFIATFAMMFGSFAAGQANQYGPDMGKAKKAGSLIFTLIDIPSKINPVDIPDGSIPVPNDFKGEIEVKDVWFRYPSRKDEWVFKGLNLKIMPNESVAVVGESGCGKSTLVNLILRFYDPTEGEVLIDGVNIKKYNLRQLRQRMGYVMQEPTLFNYTIKENVLYGNSIAKDSEIKEAVAIANAAEFIDANSFSNSFEDSASSLYQAFKERESIITESKGSQYFKETMEKLTHLVKKEEQEGKFVSVKGEMDDRQDKSYNDVVLSNGYEVDCGVKGGKLSGGQKQRIAIARAVIRKPNILILDEATSALDEEAQRMVQQALDNVMKGRTSIVIAHRLTTVEKCTRVVVIEEGKVVESGKFSELKNQEGGFFNQLAAGMTTEAAGKVKRHIDEDDDEQ